MRVIWGENTKQALVNLEPVFENITSDTELKAVLKYYFILATAERIFGHERHCIPANENFFKHLTKVCNQYGKVESDIEVDHDGRCSRRLVAAYQRHTLVVEAPVFDTSDDENDSESTAKRDKEGSNSLGERGDTARPNFSQPGFR